MFGVIITIVVFIYLNTRLNKLEALITQGGVPQKKPQMPPQQPAQATASRAINTDTIAQPAVAISGLIGLPPTPTTADPVQSQPKIPSVSNQNTEFALGSKVLTGVGLIAVFLGVIFFLRYAFDHDLISESARVALGVVFGLVLIAVGHILKKKYENYGLSLIGGGLSVMYLSVYAAYGYYSLITMPVAFGILVIVMVVGVLLSLLYNSLPLISYSLAGGFLIPAILPLTLSVHVLFGYLLILNLSIVLIAKYRTWPQLPVGSILGTSIIAIKWVTTIQAESLFVPTCIYLTAIFLIYVVTSFIHYSKEQQLFPEIDSFLLFAIPTIYYVLNASMLRGKEPQAMLLLGIGLFCGAFSVLVRALYGQQGHLKKLSDVMICISALGIAAATAVHFEARTLTVIWAFEAALILVIGALLHARINRHMGIALAILTALRAFFFNLSLPPDAVPFFNERTLMLLVVAVPFLLMYITYKYYVENGEMSSLEQSRGKVVGSVTIWIIILVGLTLDATDFIHVKSYLYMPLIWAIFALLAIAVSHIIEEVAPRYLSYMLAAFTLLFFVFSQWTLPDDFYAPLLNIRVLTVAVYIIMLAISAYLLEKNVAKIPAEEQRMKFVFSLAAYLLLFWTVTAEILNYFNAMLGNQRIGGYSGGDYQTIENTKRVVLSLAWLAYAIVSLAIGIFYRSLFARYGSIVLFIVVILKVFLYDTANLSDIYRFVSYISLGVVLLLAGFAYYRFKERIIHFVKVDQG